jgi:hypothetical protein
MLALIDRGAGVLSGSGALTEDAAEALRKEAFVSVIARELT